MNISPSLHQTLGKVGRVAEVYGDGDLKIDVKGSMWTFNSQAVRKVDGDGMPLTPSTSGKGLSSPLNIRKAAYTVVLCWRRMQKRT